MQYFIIITAIQYLAGTHTCPFLLNVFSTIQGVKSLPYKTNNIAQKVVLWLFKFTFIPAVSMRGKWLLLIQYKPGALESWCGEESAFAQLWNLGGITYLLSHCLYRLHAQGAVEEICSEEAQPKDCAAPLCPCLPAKMRNPCGIYRVRWHASRHISGNVKG